MTKKQMALAVVAASGIMVTGIPARAEVAAITQSTVACPSKKNLMAVYEAIYPTDGSKGADADKIELLIDHYDCKFLPTGRGVLVVSRGPLLSTITLPSVFSQHTWLYIRSIDMAKGTRKQSH